MSTDLSNTRDHAMRCTQANGINHPLGEPRMKTILHDSKAFTLGKSGLKLVKNTRLFCWAAISVSLALTSCEKPKAEVETGPPEVFVTEVIQKEVPVIRQWVGTLNGVQNAQVRARETGYLQTIAYQQGGYVKKGDLLFEIDPRPFVAALDQAKSQLTAAQATLLGVELDAKRAKELFQTKVISEQEYTNKTQEYQTKLASAAAAQAEGDEAQLYR